MNEWMSEEMDYQLASSILVKDLEKSLQIAHYF